jgi:hypothetical protein
MNTEKFTTKQIENAFAQAQVKNAVAGEEDLNSEPYIPQAQ